MMGIYKFPPPPLTKEQFFQAIKDGKTTMREIDPAFANYCERSLLGFKIKNKRLDKKLF